MTGLMEKILIGSILRIWLYLFDHLIQNLEYQVEQDLRQEGSNYKRKKKKEKWQRR